MVSPLWRALRTSVPRPRGPGWSRAPSTSSSRLSHWRAPWSTRSRTTSSSWRSRVVRTRSRWCCSCSGSASRGSGLSSGTTTSTGARARPSWTGPAPATTAGRSPLRWGSRSTSRGRSTGSRGRCCGTTPPRPATSSRDPTASRGPAARARRRAIAGSSRRPWVTSASAGARRTGRQRSQTAPSARPSAEFVTVTLPVHPFCGRRLVLIYSAVTKDGRRYVHVEGPEREMIVLPEAWTDRGAPVAAPPRVSGREVLLSARGLLELARTVADALDRQRDPRQVSEEASIKRSSEPVDAISPDRSTRSNSSGRAAGRRAARPGGRVGNPRAQDAAGRGGPRGRS